jgi:hypothetical protein
MNRSFLSDNAAFGVSLSRSGMTVNQVYAFDYQSVASGKNMQDLTSSGFISGTAILTAPDYDYVTFF